MSECAIIGIGGTGARCVEALVHLCAAGLGPDNLFILLIDPDSANGNLQRTRETIQGYEVCRKALNVPDKALLPGSIPTFHTKLRYGQRNEPHHLVWSPMDMAEGVKSLGGLFQFNLKPQWQNLCRAFYSDYELNDLVWDMGFRGHASVAAPAMATVRQHLERQPWADLLNVTKNALAVGNQKTFIVGSAFGATGAGGFPVIPQILRDVAVTKGWEGRDRYGIGGALLLPYMMFEAPSTTEEERHAHANRFLMNTQAALLHYRRVWANGSPYDAVYYLGAMVPDSIDRAELGGQFALGGSDQRNPAHFIEMMTALSALDFFSRDIEYERIDDRKRSCHPFAIAGTGAKKVDWADLPDIPFREVKRGTSNLQRHLVSYLTTMVAMTEFFAPLFHDKTFEEQRRKSAWYRQHFAPRSLTDKETLDACDGVRAFAKDRTFPWYWQWQQTSKSRPVQLFNADLLAALVAENSVPSIDNRRRKFSKMLHSVAGGEHQSLALDDGFTALWDHMCRQPGPSGEKPLEMFWQMLYRAAVDFAEARYKFERSNEGEKHAGIN